MAALVPVAWADDGTSYSVSDLTTEYTIDDVKDGTTAFALVNEDDNVLFYSKTGENWLYLGNVYELGVWGTDYYEAQTFTVSSEVTSGNYLLSVSNNKGYFQSQPTTGTVSFGYSVLKSNYGADGDNLALWQFEPIDGGGYKIKNAGTNSYLGSVAPSPAKSSEKDAAIWHLRPITDKTFSSDYSEGEDITGYALTNKVSSSSSKYGTIPFTNEIYSSESGYAAGNDIITHTFSNLKNGEYEVTVYAAVSCARGVSTATGTDKSVVAVNDKSLPLNVVNRTSVAAADFESFKFNVLVEDGTIKCGINNLALSGNWCLLRTSKIVYERSLSSTVTAYLNEAKLLTLKSMNADVLSKLNTAISSVPASLEEQTETTLISLAKSLIKAVENAKASVAVYESIAAYAEEISTKVSNLDSDGKSYFNTNSTEVTTKVSNGEYETYADYESDITSIYVKAVKAQTTANADWTGALSNPDFKTNDLSGWTFSNTNKPTVDVTYHDCEYISTSFDMTQTISGMKKGTYEIALQAFQRLGGMNDGATMMKDYKNDNWTSEVQLYTSAQTSEVMNICEEAQTTQLYDNSTWMSDRSFEYESTTYYLPNSMAGARAWFDAGHYKTSAKAIVTEEGGNLTFGFRGMLSDAHWLIFDNFTLTYLNDEVSVDEKETTALLAQVPAEGVIYNAELKKEVDGYVATLKETPTNGTAFASLQSIIGTAQLSVDAYKSVKESIDKLKGIEKSTNVYTADALATFQKEYTEAETKYNAGSFTTDEANEYVTNVSTNVLAVGKNRQQNTVDDFLLSAWGTTDYKGVPYINTWSISDVTDLTAPFYEYWVYSGSLAKKTLTATLNGLEAGKYYDVTALTRIQCTSTADDPYGITLQVGSGIPVNVCDVTVSAEGENTSKDNSSDAARYLGTYTATGKADADGTLTITYNVAEDNNVSWLIFQNVKYTESTASMAEAEKVQTLRNEIAGYLNKIGFEDGEYAPYNNIEAIANASTIQGYLGDEGNVTAAEYEAANALLTAKPWVANEGEVNAIYDPTFEKAEANAAPFGWTMINDQTLGGGTNARVLNNTTLSAFNNNSTRAFYIRFDSQYKDTKDSTEYYYGNTDGYTLPLKANTVYYVEADFNAWVDNDFNVRLGVSGPEDFNAVGVAKMTTADFSQSTTVAPQHIYVPFKTKTAGNYNLTLSTTTGKERKAVITNFKLYTLQPQTRSIKNDGIGTICLPYEFTATGADIYAVSSVEDNTVKLTKVETAEPGVAYIYQATADAQTFAIADEATVLQEPVSANYLNGVFTQTTVDQGNYVLQDQGNGAQFYKVSSDDIVLSPFRAYLSVPATSSEAALRISFDGETTGVEAVKALTDENAVIYDLNGRKLNRLQKGINVVNGVKVFVK